jgi:drug/metabolite transporter (DMT)-like permease
MQVECRLANSYSKWLPTAMAPQMSVPGNGFWPFFAIRIFFQRLYCTLALHFYGCGFLVSHLCLRAYPFVALAFALTPLLAGSLFGETISLRLIIGLLLILGGLFFVSA